MGLGGFGQMFIGQMLIEGREWVGCRGYLHKSFQPGAPLGHPRTRGPGTHGEDGGETEQPEGEKQQNGRNPEDATDYHNPPKGGGISVLDPRGGADEHDSGEDQETREEEVGGDGDLEVGLGELLLKAVQF